VPHGHRVSGTNAVPPFQTAKRCFLPPTASAHALRPRPLSHWTEHGQPCSALWRSERGAAAPAKVVLADDTMTADAAYQLACGGTALLWRGDFNNARQLLEALQRRIDPAPAQKPRRSTQQNATRLCRRSDGSASLSPAPPGPSPARPHSGHGAAAVRSADYAIPLRRAPDAKLACTQAWGAAAVDESGQRRLRCATCWACAAPASGAKTASR